MAEGSELRRDAPQAVGERLAARERGESAPAPKLGVLDRRNLLERARRRQARLLVVLAAALVGGSLGVAAVSHAVLAGQQIQLDNLQSQVSSTLQTQQNLQLRRAELSTPSRVLRIAEQRYHMVSPGPTTYLKPVNPGETVYQAHRAAAPSSRP